MGLLFGTRAHVEPETEARASYPAITQEQLAAMTGDLGTFASVNANGEVARQSVAVDTAIDLLCSLASEMPLHVYRGSGSDRVQLSTPSNLQDPGDTGQGLEDWVYMLVNSWLYRGNAYGQETAWDSRGRARQIDLYYPDDVSVVIVGGVPNWSVNGTPVDRPDLFFHRRVNPVPGKVLGASVIEKHARVIGTSISAARYGEQWFKEGAHPSGMLVNDADLTRDQIKAAKSLWMEQFRGSREPAAMGRGWQWKQLQVSANESQFLETMRYTEAQCARMFGPAVAETMGYETGGSMTYANVVDRRSDLLTFTLGKWLRRTERILTGLLPDPQYARFDRDSLLASDTLKRYEAHAMALTNRFRTVNEVRDDEDMAPVPWGDEPNEKAAAASTPEPTRSEPVHVHNNVSMPPVNVDARTDVQVDGTQVDARTEWHEGALQIDATTALLEDSIKVDARTTVTQTEPAVVEPVLTRKRVETDDAGRITAIIEERA